jgi:DNA primase
MVEKKDNRKFFELRNGMKAVDFRNKDYYDRIDDKERSLYSPYMIMRYASAVSGDRFYQEHYVEMINECVNKHLFTLSSRHKKLCWILTAMCGSLKQQFHPWVKPMKKTANKSMQQLLDIFPSMKESDVETLDKIITDGELEELLEAHGQQS